MKPKAIVLTSAMLHSDYAKTAHGLIRSSEKYDIVGVLDSTKSGQDAGEILDGVHRGVPVYANLEEALEEQAKIDVAIIGVATPGGVIPPAMAEELILVLEKGISVINGLHTFLSDFPKYTSVATKSGAIIEDIRKAKPRKELSFWTGEIFKVTCPIIAVLGTDCALGKRTTTKILVDALKEKGIRAEMIFTGQTGKLQQDGYGFVFDSTLNDFVSGELEAAILKCYQERQPDVILLEGQAALFNPSGPCGSEYLISANAKKVILQHAPSRTCFKGWESLNLRIPNIEKTIKLIELYDAAVIGICLNESTTPSLPPMSKSAIEAYKVAYTEQFNIPVINPIRDDLTPMLEAIQHLL